MSDSSSPSTPTQSSHQDLASLGDPIIVRRMNPDTTTDEEVDICLEITNEAWSKAVLNTLDTDVVRLLKMILPLHVDGQLPISSVWTAGTATEPICAVTVVQPPGAVNPSLTPIGQAYARHYDPTDVPEDSLNFIKEHLLSNYAASIETTGDPEDTYRISTTSTRETSRRQGFASALYSVTASLGRADGQRTSLEVFTEQVPAGLERLGFHEVYKAPIEWPGSHQPPDSKDTHYRPLQTDPNEEASGTHLVIPDETSPGANDRFRVYAIPT
ncbi:hypothetical protein L202_03068 [Cryptococcus amylolentus CBS 6039]|uniref:Uncharacterized protein n=1 Tax=Cryptococcus amylolentus CBS 6039 TaxID=1295533 RepID=A0A1E3HXT7_9TREE|nr:hypothetical protein L202_03068 [Cryptococcus amylolentus CBS 6039]ODN80955.1 hypothetical protein L202_03068 [Cryptococcus amylolentus CBS 6039]